MAARPSVFAFRRARFLSGSALRSSARSAEEFKVADAPAGRMVCFERAGRLFAVRAVHRRRGVPHFHARGLHARPCRLVSYVEPSPVPRFYCFLADRDVSAAPNRVHFSQIFQKISKKTEKHLFKQEKIGYNKKTKKTIGGNVRCAYANRHSLPNSSYWPL